MKTLLAVVASLGLLCGCKAFDVQTDPSTGQTHIVDTASGESVGSVASPADKATSDPSGVAGAAGTIVGAVTGNPGAGALAGVGVSWLLALLSRRKKA